MLKMFMGWIWIGHLKHIFLDRSCEASIRPYLCAGYFGGETSIGHSFVGGGTILKWIR
jgi:hypothetical protein